MCVMSRSLRSLVNSGADALESATAANIPVHRFVDIGVGGMRLFFQQRGGLHDLAGLAVAALRHIEIAPRNLQRDDCPWDRDLQS